MQVVYGALITLIIIILELLARLANIHGRRSDRCNCHPKLYYAIMHIKHFTTHPTQTAKIQHFKEYKIDFNSVHLQN